MTQQSMWRAPLIRRTALAVAGVALALVMGGCDNNKAQLEAMKQENLELRSQKEQAEAQARDAQSQVSSLQAQNSMLQQQSMSKSTGDGGGGGGGSRQSREGRDQVIEIAGDVLFGSGSATLKPEARTELNKIAKDLTGRYNQYNIRVEGHTDSDPIRKSKWKTNEALSEARARAVADYLSTRGVSAGRMSVVGMGASKPKGTKKDSRRVDIVILGAG